MSHHQKIVCVLPFVLCFGFALAGVENDVTLTLFMMIWMVSWWVFEVVPLGITACLPLVFLPFTGILPLKAVTSNYANPIIYLFLGGFMIARALEKTKLSERIALVLLNLTGKSDKGIVLGFVLATAFLSMWISNTATTVMMVPIALSVMNFLEKNIAHEHKTSLKPMSTALFLGIAYSANIGGIMTPIGTPPNVVFLGYLEDMFQYELQFDRWFMIAAPTAMVLLALMVLLLNRVYPYRVPVDQKFRTYVKDKLTALGQIDGPQRITLVIFMLTASLWVFKGGLHYLLGQKVLNDTSVAILGGFLLFVLPTSPRRWTPVLDQDDIPLLPWNIVLLFGGGMALAAAMKEAGIIQVVTSFLAALDLGSPYVLVFMLAFVTLFLTEVMSNVALCVVALPVIMNLGETQGMHPFVIALPATLCASFAFSMPVSTPPNAIVFGTNRVRVIDMVRAGVILNIIGVGVVMTVSWSVMTVLVG
jgi:sodium-dependent dicarboxylate transporter 2/3/5